MTAPVPPEQARDGRGVPVLVSIERGADTEAVAADLASIGLTVTRVLPRAGVICGDVWATMIPALEAAPGVVAVELDRPVTAAVPAGDPGARETTDVRRRLAEASPNDLLIAIHRAIEAGDFEAVAAFLHVLAVKDPRAAQDVLYIVEIAQAIAR